MSDASQRVQLGVLAVLATLITVGSLAYMLWAQPASLRVSRQGVPFFTPAVIQPDTGEAITVDRLVEHFKGEH